MSVTVSVTRQVDPAHEDEMLAWMSAGFSLAERFPGFLGHGWVRPAPDSSEWHMLYRFADAESLERWNASDQRRWWLGSAQAFVAEQRFEKRTGIEGWFDAPSSVDVQDLRPAPSPPPRWKQMVAIFIAFFPLSLGANYAARALVPDWSLVLRILASSLVMIPLMTYVVMPWITRLLAPWLNRSR
jgi:antibiotic biosynthesis monooxygenase (ABM) superfamily enzyme